MSKNSTQAIATLNEAYALLNVITPDELVRKFIAEDQKLLTNGTWDYKNKTLLTNKVKELVEHAIENGLVLSSKEGNDDLRDILWFWYHHAIGQAIWGTKDQELAKEFSAKALLYIIHDNPNKITRLLCLLVRNQLEEAQEWLGTITTEPDKTTAQGIMEEYTTGGFFT